MNERTGFVDLDYWLDHDGGDDITLWDGAARRHHALDTQSGGRMSDPTITPPCTCPLVDPDLWTTCGSAVEPGSMFEFDPECPEHRIANGPAPASSPGAVTVWCGECDGTSDVDVTRWTVETDPHGVDYWVRRLDCGHEEVRPI